MEKKPFSSMVEKEKSPKAKYFLFTLIGVVVVVLITLFFISKSRSDGDKPKSEKYQTMEGMVNKIQALETDINDKQNEVVSLIADYKRQTGKELPAMSVLNLSPEEKTLLEDKIKEESQVNIKSLLRNILDKNTEISQLQGKIKEVEAKLPQAYVAGKGDKHFKLAFNFLTVEKGVDPAKAKELIEKASLFEQLVPGFKVWNYYADDEYGTFVTQGTASVSPNHVTRVAKKKLVDAKNQAISERDKLSEDITTLEMRKAELQVQIETLNGEKDTLTKQNADLTTQNTDLETKVNSMFYKLDLEKNLVKSGIIKGGFLRSTDLKNFSPDDFKSSIDLRNNTTINVTATEFNIQKIKELNIYPKFYKRNEDYSVTVGADKQSAVLTILKPEKLKNNRVVISVS